MDNKFIRVDEVAQELSVSKPYAYKFLLKVTGVFSKHHLLFPEYL